jgi:hypothetical protein
MQEKEYDYEFKELEKNILGRYDISDYFRFTMNTNDAPSEGEKVLIGEDVYEVYAVVEDSSEYDEEESCDTFSIITMNKIIEEDEE